MLELKRHKEKLLKDNNPATIQTHQQRTITTFFSPITPTHASSQSRAAQIDSKPGDCKGVTTYHIIGVCHTCRPQPHAWTTMPPPLSPTIKDCYLPPSQVLPSLRRPLHFGLTYVRDLLKKKITICLT